MIMSPAAPLKASKKRSFPAPARSASGSIVEAWVSCA
jgi:hypothetical protein